jgi:hypothetical protein
LCRQKRFDFAIEMGDKCRLRLFELAQYRLETQQQEKQRDKLLELKTVTDRQRKSLPVAQTDALREQLLVLRIKALQPSYYGTNVDYHALNHNLTVQMVPRRHLPLCFLLLLLLMMTVMMMMMMIDFMVMGRWRRCCRRGRTGKARSR